MLDHSYLNDIIEGNPTAENIGSYLILYLNNCYSGSDTCFKAADAEVYKVKVQETEGNVAIIEKGE